MKREFKPLVKKCPASLMTDFYKQAHMWQYNPNMNLLVSYYTNRGSRLKDFCISDLIPDEKVIIFGIQGFIKEILIDYFNETFFCVDEEEAMAAYERYIRHTFVGAKVDSSKMRQLHRLGYLPLQISAIPEGTMVPVKIPVIEIKNLQPKEQEMYGWVFVWAVNFIETAMQSYLHKLMTIANVAYGYRQIVNRWYDLAADDNCPRHAAIAEFAFRGSCGPEQAAHEGAAWLTSFSKTATIPAIWWLEQCYNANIEREVVGQGMISTEHSVMTSNAIIDGDEETLIYKLLTEIYPSGNFSMVSDSYDYWNVVNNILPSPKIKAAILSRKGTLFVRGDSGDPVEIIVKTVQRLWENFGGTINTKGFKVLDSHIRAIYGDSITQERTEQIYRRLYELGFAPNNVALGAGSFSFFCIRLADGRLIPYTRDTFNVAIKTTYGELMEVDGSTRPLMIFKDPKTDSDNFKKSQKGMCRVYQDEDGVIRCQDNFTSETIKGLSNMLIPVFQNGAIVNETTFAEIRERLHKGKF